MEVHCTRMAAAANSDEDALRSTHRAMQKRLHASGSLSSEKANALESMAFMPCSVFMSCHRQSRSFSVPSSRAASVTCDPPPRASSR